MQATGRGSSDRTARVIVWAAWTGMLVLLLWCYLPVSSPVPLAEDWYLVPLLTGQPAELSAWLWEQNNEHRMPVARLLLLGAVKASHGDYRAGGLLNMAVLAGGAAGLILFVRHLRGGVNDPADAFFPLTLLNFGHSVDVLFPFQITFVLSLALILVVGCALFLPASVSSARAAAAAGAALMLLPLSGFIGLLFVPPLAAYLFYAGWCCRSGSRGWPRAEWVGVSLMTVAAGAVALGTLYFVGYEHPSWNPPNPGVVPSLKIVLKMFSLGFGPAPHFWWTAGVLAAVLFLAASCWQAARRLRPQAADRQQAIGAALFLATTIGFVVAVGWGRTGLVPQFGIPLRYVSIAAPAFIAGYLSWVVSGSRSAPAVLRTLALTMVLLLPVNTVAGYRLFADWYHEGMTALETDLRQGVPLDELAVRYNKFLVHWWSPEVLERHMRMLHDARVPPFDRAVTR